MDRQFMTLRVMAKLSKSGRKMTGNRGLNSVSLTGNPKRRYGSLSRLRNEGRNSTVS
jgi:hypothetical protein